MEIYVYYQQILLLVLYYGLIIWISVKYIILFYNYYLFNSLYILYFHYI